MIPVQFDPRTSTSPVGRRRFFQIGGLSVATATLVAACGGAESNSGARVGVAPERTALPDAVVNDVVLLRTASSLERSAIAVYDAVIGNTDLLAAALQDAAKRFRDDHVAHAELFEQLTTDAGGEPWQCGNPRIDQLVVAPVFAAIQGAKASGTVAEVPASDDPQRDVLNFAHALEDLAAQTYQALVPQFSEPELRRQAMVIGSQEARHSSLLALAITGRTDGYVMLEAPADPPQIPVVYAIPSTFGLQDGTQLVVGAQDEVGQRKTYNLETPSLNTFVYEYLTPEC
jgi:rubrerythrin